jgi:virginiamycin B lyase
MPAGPAQAQPPAAVTEFALAGGHGGPWGITAGPRGHLWVTEDAGYQQPLVGEFNTAGALVHEHALPANDPALQQTQLGTPGAITTGSDGNLWFAAAAFGDARIGRMTPAGTTWFEPVGRSDSVPDLTVGPDAAVWFPDRAVGGRPPGSSVDRIAPDLTGNAFAFGKTVDPHAIATSGGALWVTADQATIWRVATSGAMTPYQLPRQLVGVAGFGAHPFLQLSDPHPEGITLGPDGALWFCEHDTAKIGRMTTDGTLTNEFPLPSPNSGPSRITIGLDGALWFTEPAANRIGRTTTAGAVNEYTVPTTNSGLGAIAVGPDGNIWFTEENAHQVGRLNLADAPTISGVSPHQGVWGDSVDIVGRGLSATSQVAFNGKPASYTVVDDTRVRAVVPTGATSGPLALTTPTATLSGGDFDLGPIPAQPTSPSPPFPAGVCPPQLVMALVDNQCVT